MTGDALPSENLDALTLREFAAIMDDDGLLAATVAPARLRDAAVAIERLTRERQAALESIAWRANWGGRVIELLGDLLDADIEEPYASTIVDLLAEEFGDGDD